MRAPALVLASVLLLAGCSATSTGVAAPQSAASGPGAWSPAQQGFDAATGDPATMPATPGLSPGVLYVNRVVVDQAEPIRTAYAAVISPGVGLGHTYLGVYDPASNRLLGATADVSAAFQTAQAVRVPLNPPVAAQPTGKALWLVLLIGSMTRTPTVVGGREFGSNLGLSKDFRLLTPTQGRFGELPPTLPLLAPPAHGSIPFLAVGP